MAFAGFSPGEAEGLRRAMSRKRSAEAIEAYHQRFLDGARGDPRRGRGGRRARLRHDRRLLGLRLPEGPRRRLRPARLPVDLAARPPRPGVPVRAAQRAADGLLRAGHAGPRGPAPRDRAAPAGRQRERSAVHGRVGAGDGPFRPAGAAGRRPGGRPRAGAARLPGASRRSHGGRRRACRLRRAACRASARRAPRAARAARARRRASRRAAGAPSPAIVRLGLGFVSGSRGRGQGARRRARGGRAVPVARGSRVAGGRGAAVAGQARVGGGVRLAGRRLVRACAAHGAVAARGGGAGGADARGDAARRCRSRCRTRRRCGRSRRGSR